MAGTKNQPPTGITINLTKPNAAVRQPVDPQGSARELAELMSRGAALPVTSSDPAPAPAPAPRRARAARAARSSKRSAVIVRMPLELRAMLDQVSIRTGVSLTALVCVALSFYLLKQMDAPN